MDKQLATNTERICVSMKKQIYSQGMHNCTINLYNCQTMSYEYIPKYTESGVELRLFIGGAKINIIKYNIYFNLLYMNCKSKSV
jgi:hypothetical protein